MNMEIIREANFREVVWLEEVDLLSERLFLWTFFPILISLLVLVAFTFVFDSPVPTMVFSCLVFIIASGNLIYTRTHIVPQQHAEFENHNYYLAMIDNPDDFEHESYRLADHHKDNTYFVEDVRDSEEN